MTHDDQNNTTSFTLDTGADTDRPDATGAAFAAAITAGLRKVGGWRDRFRRRPPTRRRSGTPCSPTSATWRLPTKEQEDAIRNRYPRAALDWNRLQKRARAHGIAFSVTAQAHHRAAVLDYLDNPGAPTVIAHKHLTWFAPIRTSDLQREMPTTGADIRTCARAASQSRYRS